MLPPLPPCVVTAFNTNNYDCSPRMHPAVFKTATGESWATDSFIRRIVQPYYGPSYHAVSPVLSVKDVPRAQIIVALPNATQLSVNATNERVARFGLTVTSEPGVGNLSQLEVGVEFDGMGWAPYFRTSIIQGVGLRTMPVLYPGKAGSERHCACIAYAALHAALRCTAVLTSTAVGGCAPSTVL
jgi:hypothetical protein